MKLFTRVVCIPEMGVFKPVDFLAFFLIIKQVACLPVYGYTAFHLANERTLRTDFFINLV